MNNFKLLVSLFTILLGIIALALGIFLFVAVKYITLHPLRAYTAIGVGIVLIIVGIALMIVNREKTTANHN